MTAPQINNKYPEAVRVVANSTIATNGDVKGEKFTSNNYSYDETTGKIDKTKLEQELGDEWRVTETTGTYISFFHFSASPIPVFWFELRPQSDLFRQTGLQ